MENQVSTETERKQKGPAMRGLTEACKEGRMENKQKIIEQIDKILKDAEEQQLRLVLIATKGILRK